MLERIIKWIWNLNCNSRHVIFNIYEKTVDMLSYLEHKFQWHFSFENRLNINQVFIDIVVHHSR